MKRIIIFSLLYSATFIFYGSEHKKSAVSPFEKRLTEEQTGSSDSINFNRVTFPVKVIPYGSEEAGVPTFDQISYETTDAYVNCKYKVTWKSIKYGEKTFGCMDFNTIQKLKNSSHYEEEIKNMLNKDELKIMQKETLQENLEEIKALMRINYIKKDIERIKSTIRLSRTESFENFWPSTFFYEFFCNLVEENL